MLTEIQKRKLVAHLISVGAPADQAEVTVDLALHAMEEAIKTFGDRCKAAPTAASVIVAFQIGAQLAAQRFQMLGEGAVSFGDTLGMGRRDFNFGIRADQSAS